MDHLPSAVVCVTAVYFTGYAVNIGNLVVYVCVFTF